MTLTPASEPKTSLIGLNRDELTEIVKSLGEPAFRAKQLWHWIYQRGASSFDDMTTLSKSLREKLKEKHHVNRPEITKDYISIDGTRKWLLKFEDGQEVEAVFIPDDDRGTLCVSSQVGCTLTCTFCHTGTQKMVRNLTPADILNQLMIARDALGDWPSSQPGRKVTNIVMMGMGEPLLNYDNVAKALKIYMDPEGISLSKRRITLSTSGIVPAIEKCGEELAVNLAISLHAVRDDLRDEIVPINRKWKIAELLDACRNYPAAGNTRRITFEYVMLNGVNDTDDDARELVRLLKDIPAKVNLIPFNAWPGSNYTCSSNNRINSFAQIVMDAGYASPIRTPRGQDILAACGQLKSESVRERRSS